MGVCVPSAQFHGPGFLEDATGRIWNDTHVVRVFVAFDLSLPLSQPSRESRVFCMSSVPVAGDEVAGRLGGGARSGWNGFA